MIIPESFDEKYQTAVFTLRKGDAANAYRIALDLQHTLQETGIPTLLLANTMNLLGATVYELGDYLESITWSERAAVLYRQLGSVDGEFAAQGNIATGRQARGEYKQAADVFEGLLQSPVSASQPLFRAQVKNNLGICHFMLGDALSAQKYYHEALAEHRQNGQEREATNTLINLANAQAEAGELESAVRTSIEALEQARVLANPMLIFQSLISRANALGFLDRVKDATGLYEEALEIARIELQNPHYEALAKSSLAAALIDSGRVSRGKTLYRQAKATLHALGDRTGEAKCWMGLGLMHFMKGDFREAIMHFEKSIKMFSGLDEKRKRGAQIHLADAYARLNLPEAEVIYRAVLDKCSEQHDLNQAAECHVRLMGHTARRNNLALCQTHFEAADRIFATEDRPDSQGFAVLAWANALHLNGRHDEAIETFSKAARLFERSQNDRLRAYALNNAALPLILQNRLDEGKTMLDEARRLASEREVFLLQRVEENLALWNMKNGFNNAAFHCLKRAIKLLERSYEKLRDESWQIAFGSAQTRAYHMMCSVCYKKGDLSGMLHYLERSRSRAFLESLAVRFSLRAARKVAKSNRALNYLQIKKQL